MKPTEQQIQERANYIGDKEYYPLSGNYAGCGISIRFELMRTAMGGMSDNHNLAVETIAKNARDLTNALLLEMARQELGSVE